MVHPVSTINNKPLTHSLPFRHKTHTLGLQPLMYMINAIEGSIFLLVVQIDENSKTFL